MFSLHLFMVSFSHESQSGVLEALDSTSRCLDEAVLTSIHNLYFDQKYEKYQSFSSENFQFLKVKFYIYFNKRVFVMSLQQ